MSEEPLALALQHHKAGRLEDAQRGYLRVLEKNPQNANALQLLGLLSHQLGRHDEAASLITQAIAIDPSRAHFHSNLGMALRALGRLDDAAASFERALALKPDYVEAHFNLGNLYSKRNQLSKAVESYQAALRINPSYAAAHNNLGNVHRLRQNREDAINAYRKAIESNPRYSEAYGNLGIVLTEQGEVAEGIAAFRTALKLDPANAAALSGLLLALHYDAEIPPEKLFIEHRTYQSSIGASPIRRFTHANKPSLDRRLRVGYVSPDFRMHSVAFFIKGILQAHDRAKFEVFAYSDVAVPDAVTHELKRHVDVWRDVGGLSHAALADLIFNDHIDILVDLAGHTGDNRLPVFACKPAPVQVTYLGYPNTTGLVTMDYRITDHWADPAGLTEPLHSEQLVRLAPGFLAYTPPPQAPAPVSRPAERSINFGSFNNIAKVNTTVISLWATILRTVPNCRLLLKSFGLKDGAAQERVHREFDACGISCDRITLLPPTENTEDHLRAYDQLDIALDTFPYCGTTTTCEALWMGVPVITLAGQTHASRMGVSLLSRVGLPELIASTPGEYVQMAGDLAANVQRRAELRTGLRPKMEASSLMDAKSVTAGLEQAYRMMQLNAE
jgi:protein O-GlcNAc transferase